MEVKPTFVESERNVCSPSLRVDGKPKGSCGGGEKEGEDGDGR
jgi:hypothetical protein